MPTNPWITRVINLGLLVCSYLLIWVTRIINLYNPNNNPNNSNNPNNPNRHKEIIGTEATLPPALTTAIHDNDFLLSSQRYIGERGGVQLITAPHRMGDLVPIQ
jgi:hypothetical protein